MPMLIFHRNPHGVDAELGMARPAWTSRIRALLLRVMSVRGPSVQLGLSKRFRESFLFVLNPTEARLLLS